VETPYVGHPYPNNHNMDGARTVNLSISLTKTLDKQSGGSLLLRILLGGLFFSFVLFYFSHKITNVNSVGRSQTTHSKRNAMIIQEGGKEIGLSNS
jgi:hypothetical protein